MQENSMISYNSSTIHIRKFGSGLKPVLCFHGYDENSSSYEFLAPASNDFSFYCMDLPFHGHTNWNQEFLTPEALVFVMAKIIDMHSETQLQAGNSKLILLGFSLGSRMALSAFEHNDRNVERLVLLAPDGLKVNSWYWLATQTVMGNRLFLHTMKHPGWFLGLLKILKWLGLVNQSVYKFVQHYIENERIRMLLYKRWTSLSKIKPCLSRIKKIISQQHITCRLVYGKHDRIILPSRGNKFCKGIEDYCTITIINAGHQVLHPKHTDQIIHSLNQ
jgi:pimeloyl-ACP methyl ester carboxylesterase